MDLDEPVELVPHDPLWAPAFSAERRRIIVALSLPEDCVEHIGSTAVAGLIAKPIVDIMLAIPQYPPPPELLARLAVLGYRNLGEAGVPGRTYLRLRERTPCNLHLVQRGEAHWTNNLALRDFLRRDPQARMRYAQEKQKALEVGGSRLLAYSAANNAVLEQLLEAARQR